MPPQPAAGSELPGPELEELAVLRARIASRLESVGRLIPVMSGKGGVGKSAVAVNLALALARGGARVGLLDADLSSPSVAKMLGLRGQPLRMAEAELLPPEAAEGVVVQSMDFFLQGTQAVAWAAGDEEGLPLRSLLEDAALADLLGQTRWGERDVLVIDLAPGADRLPALARLLDSAPAALAVTLPSEVSLLAVERSLRRAREAGLPLLGLVENMGRVVCRHCGQEDALFAGAGARRLARELDLELLARIPFDPGLSAAADAGRPPAGPSPAGEAFAKLAERLIQQPPPQGDSW